MAADVTDVGGVSPARFSWLLLLVPMVRLTMMMVKMMMRVM